MNREEKIILVLTDCSHGALDAGRFAAKYLFDEVSKIILLQTYQNPSQEANVMHKISPVLQKVAKRELNELRAKLSRESGIDHDKMETRVIEGDLDDIMVNEFGNLRNFSIVAGSVFESSPNKIPCKNIINTLIDCNIHPVFILTGCITLIEASRILTIAEDENTIPEAFIIYLEEIAEKKGKTVEIITKSNGKQFPLAPESTGHFSMDMELQKENLLSNERIFYERVLAVSPINGINNWE